MRRLLPIVAVLLVAAAFAGGFVVGRRAPAGPAPAEPARPAQPTPRGAQTPPIATPSAVSPEDRGARVSGEATAPGPSAIRFEGAVTADAGTWKGVHGFDGYAVVGSQTLWPSWGRVTVTGQQGEHVWANAIDGRRGIQRLDDHRRVAGCWHTATSMDIAIVDASNGRRWVTLAAIDWDGHAKGRAMAIEALGADGQAADRRNVERFGEGVLLTWSFEKALTLRVSNRNQQSNAVVSALFFSSVAPAR